MTRSSILVAILAAGATVNLRAADLAAPSDLEVQVVGSTVVLTWRAGGTIAPDAFRIEAGTGPGLADLAIVNLPWGPHQGLDAQFAAAGVAPGVYHVRVRAMNGSLASEPSADVIMHVGIAPCPLPDAPQQVSANVQSALVTLAWEPPSNGASTNGYVIEAGSFPGAPNIAIITIDDSTTISLNAPPGRYFVRLRAMGVCGASEPSSEVEVIVP